VNFKKHALPLAAVSAAVILMVAIIAQATTPSVPDFSQYPEGTERKMAFFDYFQPLIEDHNRSIRELRSRLLNWYRHRENLGWSARLQVERIASEYGLGTFEVNSESHWQTLLRRVDIIPTSLVLAQAAMESAWGTSRFAREVNNYFGQWCFKKGCGVVPGNRKEGARHEVADFDSPRESLASYFRNLNSYYAYKPFRELRARLRAKNKPITGIALADGLTFYSERRANYIEELRAFMRQNNLVRIDNQDI
jgi:Bax protein